MSQHPKNATQLQAIEAELSEATARARRLAGGLSPEDWSRRPTPERWSIGEQIVHLNLTSRGYLPGIEEAIRNAGEKGLLGDGPYRRDFLGWLLGKLTEPPVRMRVKTSASFEPARLDPPEVVMDEFERWQQAVAGAVRSAAGLALDRIDIVSPFDSRIRYNLYSCFKVIPAHQRHHLWLAERIRMELAGAGAMEAAI